MITEINEIKYNQIDEQIEIREQLIKEMVGSLYPQILRDQIEKLKILKKEKEDFIQKDEMKLK